MEPKWDQIVGKLGPRQFVPVAWRSGIANSVQFSEVEFQIDGSTVDLSKAVATNPGGSNPSNERPPKAIDKIVTTKW